MCKSKSHLLNFYPNAAPILGLLGSRILEELVAGRCDVRPRLPCTCSDCSNRMSGAGLAQTHAMSKEKTNRSEWLRSPGTAGRVIRRAGRVGEASLGTDASPLNSSDILIPVLCSRPFTTPEVLPRQSNHCFCHPKFCPHQNWYMWAPLTR